MGMMGSGLGGGLKKRRHSPDCYPDFAMANQAGHIWLTMVGHGPRTVPGNWMGRHSCRSGSPLGFFGVIGMGQCQDWVPYYDLTPNIRQRLFALGLDRIDHR